MSVERLTGVAGELAIRRATGPTGPELAQQERWFQNGQCITCGWFLSDELLAAGFEQCDGDRCVDGDGR